MSASVPGRGWHSRGSLRVFGRAGQGALLEARRELRRWRARARDELPRAGSC